MTQETRHLVLHALMTLRLPAEASSRQMQDRQLVNQALEEQLATLDDAHIDQIVETALPSLLFREREVLKLRYGILTSSDRQEAQLRGIPSTDVDHTPYTLEQLGRLFRVTREQIRKFESKALQKLHERLSLQYVDGAYTLTYTDSKK